MKFKFFTAVGCKNYALPCVYLIGSNVDVREFWNWISYMFLNWAQGNLSDHGGIIHFLRQPVLKEMK